MDQLIQQSSHVFGTLNASLDAALSFFLLLLKISGVQMLYLGDRVS